MRPKTWFIATLLIGVALFAGSNALIMFCIGHLAEQGYWLEEQVAKAHALSRTDTKHAIGFVGSSRTEYGIDTSLLSNPDIQALNFGLTGRFLNDQLYQIDHLIQIGTQVIVMSVADYELERHSKCPRNFTVREYWLYSSFRTKIWGQCPLLRSVASTLLPTARFEPYIWNFNVRQREAERLAREISSKYGRFPNPDLINSIHRSGDKYFIMMKNGDGIIYGKLEQEESKKATITGIDHDTERYLSNLKRWVKHKRRALVVVIEPRPPGSQIQITRRALSKLHRFAYVIDMTGYRFELADWADTRHFNSSGRVKYTEALRQELKKLGIPALDNL